MSGLVPKSFKSRLTEFSFSSKRDEIIPISPTDIEDDPIILLRLKITQPSGISPVLLAPYVAVQDEGRRIGVGDTVRTAWGVSDDNGVTWNDEVRTTATSLIFNNRQASASNFSFFEDITDLALFCFGDGGTTTGEIRNINSFISIFIPLGYEISRIL